MSINLKHPRVWRIALLILAANIVLFTIQIPQVYFYSLQNTQGASMGTLIARLAWGVFLWVLVTPFILWLGYKLRISGQHLWRNLLFHFLFSIVSGIVQHYGYSFGSWAFNLTTTDVFRASLFNLTSIFTFISTSTLRYAAIIGIQQAYLHFIESQERALRLQQAELQMLKMQLHPHFFFNTLNAISALIYRSPKEARRMIVQLGDLFRVALKKDKTQEVTLREELVFLEGFLQIHQTLMGKRLKVEWKIEQETLEALVPNLILQPLAENAIQHGIAPLETGGHITIRSEKRSGKLRLQVSDNGQGFASANVSNHDGIGLSNVRARLENLYNGGLMFSVNQPPEGGVTVKIEIPFREHLVSENEYQNNNR